MSEIAASQSSAENPTGGLKRDLEQMRVGLMEHEGDQLNEIRENISKKGLNPEAIEAMMVLGSANEHRLAILSGIDKESIRGALNDLSDSQLIKRAQNPHERTQLIFEGIREEVNEQELKTWAQKMTDRQRLERLNKSLPTNEKEALVEYPLFNTLLKRTEAAKENIAALRNIERDLGLLIRTIQIEFETVRDVLSEQDKKDQASRLLVEIKKRIQEEKIKIKKIFEEIYKKEASEAKKAWGEEYKGKKAHELEQISYALHTRLSRLKNAPSDESAPGFELYEEYRIKKIEELNLRIEQVESEIIKAHSAKPAPKPKKPEPGPTEPTLPKPQQTTPQVANLTKDKDIDIIKRNLASIRAKKAMDIKELKKEAESVPSPKRRTAPMEQISLAQLMRQNIHKVLLVAGLAVAAGIGVKYLASQPGLETTIGVSVELPKWQRSDVFEPEEQEFTEEEQAELDHLKKEGKVSGSVDPFTKNYYNKILEETIIHEPLVKRKINDHEVTARKSVVDHFEAAMKLLAEFGYQFEGPSSDFRTNKKELYIAKNQPPDLFAGDMITSQHLLGNAIDVPQVGMKKMTPEGEVIAQVLMIYGFNHGVRGHRLGVSDRVAVGMSDAWNIGGDLMAGKANAKEAFERIKNNLAIEDRVHFSMNRQQLETASSLEDAEKKARKYLEKHKK